MSPQHLVQVRFVSTSNGLLASPGLKKGERKKKEMPYPPLLPFLYIKKKISKQTSIRGLKELNNKDEHTRSRSGLTFKDPLQKR